MILVIGGVLAALAIAVVVYPFLKARSGREADAANGGAGTSRRLGTVPLPDGVDPESAFEAIRTLQLEYQLGKVPEEAYQEQLRVYRLQAAAALREQAQAGARDLGNTEESLEQEILIARAALQSNNRSSARCHRCGATIGSQVNGCAWCHARLAVPGPESPGVSES